MNNLNQNTRDLTEPVSADSGRKYISNIRVGNRKLMLKNKNKKSKTEYASSLVCYLPDINSSDPQERKDAIWLNEMRKAKAGLPSKEKWYPILDEVAKKFGLPNIFEKNYIINFKTKGNKNVK